MTQQMTTKQNGGTDGGVAQIRRVLNILQSGDKAVLGTHNRSWIQPSTVTRIEEQDGERRVYFRGPRGSNHRARYEPKGTGRAALDYHDPRDGWVPAMGDGELRKLHLHAEDEPGETY